MKILKLSFKNINNLKGHHEVDFTSEPLSSAGLFAITGPTGSGKSSLLDVITLALFNKIPRFSKAISKNEITNSGSVITHHTTEAEANITYSVKGNTYTSSWSITTARTGTLKDYEMFIYDNTGKALDLKKRDVPSHNESLIGLKYDQFVKSILLSQGEFAKFLKADKNERGELLEHITGTSIYRSLGVKAYEKYKTAKLNIESEKLLLGEIRTLSEEEKNSLITETEKIEESQKELDIIVKEAEKIFHVKSKLLEINQKLQTAQDEEKSIAIKFEKFIPFQKKLDVHQKLSPVQGELASYKSAVSNAKISKENLQEYKTELTSAQKKLQLAITEMQSLTKQPVEESTFKKVMSEFETVVGNMDRDLLNIKARGKEARDRNHKLSAQYPITISKDIQSKEAIDILTERAKELLISISESNIKTDSDPTKLKTQLKTKQSHLESLKGINHNYEHLDKLNEKSKILEKEADNLNKTVADTKPLIEKCETLDKSLKENVSLLQKQREDAIKIANLESLRTSLIDGDACPLCGSLEHPYTSHIPEDNNDAISQKIQSINSQIDNNTKELNSLIKKHTEATTTLNNNKESQKAISKELTEISEKNQKEISILDLNIKIDSKSLPYVIEKLHNEIILSEKAIDAIHEYKLNEELKESYAKLESISNEYIELNKKRKEKFEGTDVSVITNQLQDKFESSKSKITEMTAVIKKETDSLTRDQNLSIQIGKELQPKLSALGFTAIEELSDNILSEDHHQKITQQRDKLNHNRTSNQTSIKDLKAQQKKLLSEDTKPNIELQSFTEYLNQQKQLKEEKSNRKGELSAILKRDEDDQKKIKSKENKIKKLTTEYEKWSHLRDLIGDSNGHKFSNFAQGLTLKNLLVYANNRLKNLSDRYLLDMPGNDDALVIVDQYQGNTPRSVKTLSGGESFLISLSLALSLSDMASKNTSLESLFIDEGFGTLDHDTLELAMTTLEKLQTESQKTVGVISHVEALKERIHVQIQMNKNAQGYSSIEVSS